MPLAPHVEQDGFDLSDYPEATIEVSTYDGILYGIPTRTHVYLLFYRQDVLDELGLEVPQTWEELRETARIIDEETDMNGITLHFVKTGNDQPLNTWINFIRANGSDWFDEDWKPIFNNEAGVEATEYYLSLLEYAPPGAETFNEADARNVFAQGNAGLAPLWSWSYEVFQNPEMSVPEVIENTRFAAIPGPSGPAQSFGMTWPVGVSAFSKNQDAAWEWVKWITSDGMEKQVITDKSDPASSTIVAARFNSLTDPEANEVNNGINQAMADALKDAHRRPIIPEWPEVIDIMSTALSEMTAGAPVQETLDQAATDVEDLMQRSGYYK
jgi:multiple sugar transport system substrate-binding protein